MKKLILGAVVGGGLMFVLPVYANQHMGEAVKQDSLPAAVQKTIKQQVAGGEIVQVRREDDKDGKWNYEITVKSNGKEWGFEVDPQGRFLRKHDNYSKAE